MRNSKRFLSLVIAALMVMSAIVTSASASKFTDVDPKNEALNDAVELLTALGVTKGINATEYGTEQGVTREQMAAFVYRMMKAGKSVEGGVNNTPFVDLDDPTFYFMISWANSQGIIKGTSATTFNPKGGITLQDAYTMLVRALGYDDGTLAYPIGYISMAEDLGLDKDLPSSLNYTDTLTRGNIAIILANTFYAETAKTEIKYEASVEQRPVTDAEGNITGYQPVVTGQVPKEYHKTVAEDVFDVVKLSQRVVATPNYAYDNYERNDIDDVEMITLTKALVVDYDDYDDAAQRIEIGQIEFADLGLEGKADDYFLCDILMFVRVEDDRTNTIFGAVAQGVKKTVAFSDVKFGTVTGSSADKYYDGEDKEYKKFNGLLTIDGVKTYIFDAPYSYGKDADDYDKYNAQFIEIDDGASKDDVDEGEKWLHYAPVYPELDDEIVGFYDVDDEVWTMDGRYLAQVYQGGLGEIDCVDSNGDGKYDYLFVKNYTVAKIDTEEDNSLDANFDVYDPYEENGDVVYTDLTMMDGVAVANEDLVLAYINPDANYVKVAEVLKGTEAQISSVATKYFTLTNGNRIYFKNINAATTNANIFGGELNAYDEAGDYLTNSTDATFYFAANGKLVYVDGSRNTAINLSANYVVVLEDDVTTAVAINNGVMEKSAYVKVYNDGDIKNVKVKEISADKNKKIRDNSEEDGFYATPYTYVDGAWDFSDYVDKLATAKADSTGNYYFALVNMNINNDVADLRGDDEEAEYRGTANYASFYKRSGYIYYLNRANQNAASDNPLVDGVKGVYIRPYTQIIIMSEDKDGEDVASYYDYDNLPDIREHQIFNTVSYVLINNDKSNTYENLAVFFGKIGGQLKGAKGKAAEIRIVSGYEKSYDGDTTTYTFSLWNPFTGKTESGVENSDDINGNAPGENSIVALTSNGFVDTELGTNGKIGRAFEPGNIYEVDNDNLDDFTENYLGYVEVQAYDDNSGFLEIGDGNMYEVTADTVVTLLDDSDNAIKIVDASVLASTSKTYRFNNDKESSICVLLCTDEDNDADDDSFRLAKYVVIVRK